MRGLVVGAVTTMAAAAVITRLRLTLGDADFRMPAMVLTAIVPGLPLPQGAAVLTGRPLLGDAGGLDLAGVVAVVASPVIARLQLTGAGSAAESNHGK